MDECCRGRHLWTTLAEHLFDVGRQCARHAGRMWSNRPVPTAEGHHRPLNARRRPTWASTFPGLVTLRHYERGWLSGDLLAGVTVAAYLIPQVMAYAQIAGLPPAAGLLAVVAPTLAYAVLGSSRQLSVGPESTTALMTATAVAAVGVSGADAYAALAAALAVVTGAAVRRRLAVRPRVPRRPALQARPRRLPHRCRRADGGQPAGQPHRHRGRGRVPARAGVERGAPPRRGPRPHARALDDPARPAPARVALPAATAQPADRRAPRGGRRHGARARVPRGRDRGRRARRHPRARACRTSRPPPSPR